MLERVLAGDSTQIAAVPIDLPVFVREFPGMSRPFFAELAREAGRAARPSRGAAGERRTADGTTHAAEPTVRVSVVELLGATPPSRQRSTLLAHVQACAARVLGLDVGSVERKRPLNEQGLDSLMAVELRNALGASVERTLPATLIFDYPTVEGLTEYLGVEVLALEGMRAPAATTAVATVPSGAAGDLLSAIEGLSDADVDRLLRNEP
jgi:acyl carrier protein